MANILLESDFLTVDLNALINKNNAKTNDSRVQVDFSSYTSKDWENELTSRLEANRKLDPEARESDYKIESEFFNDYFNAKWEPDVARQLLSLGEPLKKAIKVLGFNEKTNPILAFISDSFVIDQLLKTKLLNESTFKAVYNAVAKKYIAQSQFLASNDYNILYCPDLYKKSANEMQEYIKLQNNILRATAPKYTQELLNINKKIFLDLPAATESIFSARLEQVKATDVSMLSVKDLGLNDIKLAKALSSKLLGIDNKNDELENDTADESAQQLVKLDTPAKKLAAIQYISLTKNNAKAKEALKNSSFANVSNNELLIATADLAGNMALKRALASKNTDAIINAIIG